MKLPVISPLVLGLACTSLANAEEGAGSPLDEKPVMPDEPVVIPEYEPGPSGSEIVIRPGEDVVYYEYRVNGEVREIKVVPNVGPSYYLVPADGGGWIKEDRTRLLVPSWVLFRW